MSQNDLSIANQGFASFRSDLNSALQALGSTNSGTSAPSTTYANQLFYDTTNNILKIRNEDNDAFISLFTLDQANDNIESLTINGALSCEGFTSNGIDDNADATAITITSAELVGIGTSPSTRLHVYQATGNTALRVESAEANAQASINFKNDARRYDVGINSSDSFFISDDTASSTRLTINSSGNVGIGTSSPSGLAHVYNGMLQVGSKTGDTSTQQNTNAIRISAVPNSTTEWGGLQWYREFSDYIGAEIIASRPSSDESDTDLIFKTSSTSANATERMRIDHSGLLRISNTSGTVFNSSSETGIIAGTSLQVSNSAGTVGFFNRLGGDGTILGFYEDGGIVGSIGTGSSRICIGNGDTFLTFAGDLDALYPASSSSTTPRDNAIDLGTSGTRFDDIFATNGTIQTSDQNEKQDIASATAKELNVAKKLSALFKTFRWKDKVAEKGDKARTHTGIVAQEVQSAFKAEGLDASNYGLFTSDTWWEKEISVDAVEADEEKGIEAKDAYTYMDTKYQKTDGYTEKTRLGVRYPELFSFIFSSIEARLSALEAK